MNDPILIIILLATGTAAVFAFLKFQEKKKRVIENGIEVTGIVFEYSDSAAPDFTSSGNIRTNYPTIRFVTKEGLWITEQGDYAPSGLFLKQGQKITVIYNADNPKSLFIKVQLISRKLVICF